MSKLKNLRTKNNSIIGKRSALTINHKHHNSGNIIETHATIDIILTIIFVLQNSRRNATSVIPIQSTLT